LVRKTDLEASLGGVGDVVGFLFHDLLSSYTPHGVAALEHNLNFLCN
jgi:hypothetical protein